MRKLSFITLCFFASLGAYGLLLAQLPGTSISNGHGAMPDPCISGSAYIDADTGWHYTCTGGHPHIASTNAMVFKRGTAGCSTGLLAGNPCATPITVTWSVAFPDTNYTPVCWPSGSPTNQPTAPYLVTGSKTTTTIQVNYQTTVALASSWVTVDCVAIHD